jgi:AraC-like DNA-binding protein
MSQLAKRRPEFEKIVAGGRQSFFWSHCLCRRFVAPYHYHPEYELFLVIRGYGRRLVGHSISQFGPGELVFLAPNVPHVWMVDPDCAQVEAVYVQFQPAFLGETFFDGPEWRAVRDLMTASRQGVTFSPATHRAVAALLAAFPAMDETRRLIALLEILQLLSADRKARPLGTLKGRVQFNRRQEARIDKVFQFLNQNLTRPISQAAVARSVNLSASAFSRLFKRVTRKCFMEVVNELRIEKVCRELEESGQSIAEIAYACGYETLSHFNSQFRRVMKMTPRQYRRRAVRYGVDRNACTAKTVTQGMLIRPCSGPCR